MQRDGETTEDESAVYFSRRRGLVYNVLGSELEMLAYSPWWVRRRIIRRIKEETSFEDNDASAPDGTRPEGQDGEAGLVRSTGDAVLSDSEAGAHSIGMDRPRHVCRQYDLQGW